MRTDRRDGLKFASLLVVCAEYLAPDAESTRDMMRGSVTSAFSLEGSANLRFEFDSRISGIGGWTSLRALIMTCILEEAANSSRVRMKEALLPHQLISTNLGRWL